MADNTSAQPAAGDRDVALANGSEVAENQNGQAGGQQQAAPPQSTWQTIKGIAFRIFVFYMVMSFFRKSSTPTEDTAVTTEDGKSIASSSKMAMNLFETGMMMDLRIYISDKDQFTQFNESQYLFWELTDLEYGDWVGGPNEDGSYTMSDFVDVSEETMNNGSLYAHIYFTKSGYSPDPRQKGKYAKRYTISTSKRLNRFKKRHFTKTKNLLTGATEASEEDIKRAEEEGPTQIVSHWHPNLTINIVDDHTPWKRGSVPQPLDELVRFHVSGDYYPIVYVNDYWNLNSDYMPINETTPRLPLFLTYTPISLFKLQFYAAQSMRNQWTMILGDGGGGGEDDDEQDSLKRAMLETNPYLLGLTFVVSIVHSVFEFLAFKNDIQFWNNRKSLEGLSVRSVFFGVFQSLIVLLYIMDNETNFVVKVSVFIGLIIEAWKITKVVNVKFDTANPYLGFIPVRFEDKSSYTESSTKKYDTMAFKYLSWLLFPLLAGYSVYSVIYQEHKGWYSFVLNMLYGFLLTFGFIMMTPQLFINYKLKSVAHLPWRMLTYKALNTFIDDIFAFVIKMPMLYRIGCLRDDVIFIIYVYQRYIYPVDLKRVNEFGTTGEMHIEADGKTPVDAAGEQAAIAPPKSQEEKKKD
ncbi:cleft lip and palate transmembrane protein 1 homolog [Patiria miniata]|uniref:Cleft lip and palate associated transmembrane protein n=1 Tax=Patiria miniata TaxID=46514 RepID=A0A914BQM6_PATMI|nr:cleft lip and palate transmembrane protein 1 homolog [Patiria miniata]